MKFVAWAFLSFLCAGMAPAQNTFAVTGTAIPASLMQQNYGKLPKETTGYDLNICNITNAKQSIVSSEIYQALSQSNAGLHPSAGKSCLRQYYAIKTTARELYWAW
jgi:hypothetical protein